MEGDAKNSAETVISKFTDKDNYTYEVVSVDTETGKIQYRIKKK